MRLKLVILILYVIAIVTPSALLARTFEQQSDCDRITADDATARIVKLDLDGTRGVVLFRHRHHEAYLNPSSNFPHQAQKGSECIGCHHKRTEFGGVPILVKCIACHGGEGDPNNPKNRDLDEQWSERAYHDLCIGCHRASNEKGIVKCDKAPVACNECHGPKG